MSEIEPSNWNDMRTAIQFHYLFSFAVIKGKPKRRIVEKEEKRRICGFDFSKTSISLADKDKPIKRFHFSQMENFIVNTKISNTLDIAFSGSVSHGAVEVYLTFQNVVEMRLAQTLVHVPSGDVCFIRVGVTDLKRDHKDMRHLVIVAGKLLLFKDCEQKGGVRTCVSLWCAHVEAVNEKANTSFRIFSPGFWKSLEFTATTESGRDEWIKAVQRGIDLVRNGDNKATPDASLAKVKTTPSALEATQEPLMSKIAEDEMDSSGYSTPGRGRSFTLTIGEKTAWSGLSTQEQAELFLKRFADHTDVERAKVLELKEEFDQFDEQKAGQLDYQQAMRLLEARNQTKTATELRTMLKELDTNNDLRVSFVEWSVVFFNKDMKEVSMTQVKFQRGQSFNIKNAEVAEATSRIEALEGEKEILRKKYEEEAAEVEKKRVEEEQKRQEEERLTAESGSESPEEKVKREAARRREEKRLREEKEEAEQKARQAVREQAEAEERAIQKAKEEAERAEQERLELYELSKQRLEEEERAKKEKDEAERAARRQKMAERAKAFENS
eukprot:gene15193-17972_t